MTSIGGKGPGIVAALFLFLFNTFFAIGWLGMTWLYPAEIVPLRIRAPANALSTSANWAFNFMETAYRSLEEMDSIFRKAQGATGWFSVVKIAHDEPRRYGKNGELLIAYDETEEHAQRQASVVSASGVDMTRKQRIENLENVNEEGKAEKGFTE
ncbi:MAG: hypothetical protein Q9195_003295 [Heterodermia aff. obscurata]